MRIVDKIFFWGRRNQYINKILKPLANYLQDTGFWELNRKWFHYRTMRIAPFLRKVGGRKLTREILKYKEVHRGERIFVISSGPSLREDDILKLKNEITIGVNQTISLHKKIGWVPTYYCVSDPLILEWYSEEIKNANLKKVFWNIQLRKYEKNINFSPIRYDSFLKGYYLTRYDKKRTSQYMQFSSDVYKNGVYAGGRSVSCEAMQIAAYMGAKEIYLYGCDCDYSGKAHFDDDERIVDNSGMVECLFSFYETAKEYCDKHGIKVYNATRGGKLEVFDRVDLDDVLYNVKDQ